MKKWIKTFKNSVPRSSLPILTFVIIVVAFMISRGNPPEFYDMFGVFVFTFLTIVGGWMLSTKKETSDLIAFIIMTIGLLGLIVDSYIVITKFMVGG